MGWGPDLLTVEAKSPDRAKEIAAQLAQFGFKAVRNEDDAYAGMLDLSKNPEAFQEKVQAAIESFDVSHQRWVERIIPLIWALCSTLLVPGIGGDSGRYPYWLRAPLGLFSLFMFFWDGSRIWGWKMEMTLEGLRVRRRFRWSTIGWDQIRAVETTQAGRNRERVVLKLASKSSENLGTFDCVYARRVRDRLRYELSLRRSGPPP